MLRSNIRHFIGYVVISIGSKRNVFPCVIAEKWLKRNYIVNDRDGMKGRGKGGKEQEVVGVCWSGAGVCHGVM